MKTPKTNRRKIYSLKNFKQIEAYFKHSSQPVLSRADFGASKPDKGKENERGRDINGWRPKLIYLKKIFKFTSKYFCRSRTSAGIEALGILKKTYLKKALALATIIAVIGMAYMQNTQLAQGGSNNWVQTDWGGGVEQRQIEDKMIK